MRITQEIKTLNSSPSHQRDESILEISGENEVEKYERINVYSSKMMSLWGERGVGGYFLETPWRENEKYLIFRGIY
jgi:hypothetical protein